MQKNENQQDLQTTSNIIAEKPTENTDQNQVTAPEDVVRFKKKYYPQIHVVKNTIYDLTRTLTSQIHANCKNRRLRRLNFLTLASIQNLKTLKK